ncbi:hypothetical protein A3709_19610 [Halioglobus sp. HI00S01]|nr:hypothetical protein A3709_19610 [Halioglobus sp. HI00S01]
MIDLRPTAVEESWEARAPWIMNFLQALGEREPWSIHDDELVQDELIRMGRVLDDRGIDTLLANTDDFLSLTSRLPAPTAIYLCTQLEERRPGSMLNAFVRAVQNVSEDGDADDDGRIYRDRIVMLYRFSIISELFHQDKIEYFASILARVTEAHGGLREA